jgi:hypothetical protein
VPAEARRVSRSTRISASGFLTGQDQKCVSFSHAVCKPLSGRGLHVVGVILASKSTDSLGHQRVGADNSFEECRRDRR